MEDLKLEGEGEWTKEEDERLSVLVAEYGAYGWEQIAIGLNDKTPKQCCARWLHISPPNITPMPKRVAWTKEEDDIMVSLVRKFGLKWARISKELPGRTDNAVKNRYHAYFRDNPNAQPLTDVAPPSPKISPDLSPLRDTPISKPTTTTETLSVNSTTHATANNTTHTNNNVIVRFQHQNHQQQSEEFVGSSKNVELGSCDASVQVVASKDSNALRNFHLSAYSGNNNKTNNNTINIINNNSNNPHATTNHRTCPNHIDNNDTHFVQTQTSTTVQLVYCLSRPSSPTSVTVSTATTPLDTSPPFFLNKTSICNAAATAHCDALNSMSRDKGSGIVETIRKVARDEQSRVHAPPQHHRLPEQNSFISSHDPQHRDCSCQQAPTTQIPNFSIGVPGPPIAPISTRPLLMLIPHNNAVNTNFDNNGNNNNSNSNDNHNNNIVSSHQNFSGVTPIGHVASFRSSVPSAHILPHTRAQPLTQPLTLLFPQSQSHPPPQTPLTRSLLPTPPQPTTTITSTRTMSSRDPSAALPSFSVDQQIRSSNLPSFSNFVQVLGEAGHSSTIPQLDEDMNWIQNFVQQSSSTATQSAASDAQVRSTHSFSSTGNANSLRTLGKRFRDDFS